MDMEYKTVTKGECYKFPNGKRCQVIELASDFQTGEEMVVYKETDEEEKSICESGCFFCNGNGKSF